MKILYITRKFPPSIGGMQTQSYQFYQSISKKIDVELISWGHSQFFLPLFLIFAFSKAVTKLVSKRIDLIQLGDLVLSPLGVLLKFFFNKPVLTLSHGRDAAYRNFIYNFFVINSAKSLNKVICVSHNLKQRLSARGLPDTKLTVIPNGISVNKTDVAPLSREHCLSVIQNRYGICLKGKKIILSISRLVPKKGLREFVEHIYKNIADKMDDVLLFIAGDGPERIRIQQLLGKLGLAEKVYLLGFIEHDSDIYNALFGIADVFVMPNLSVEGDAEGFGIAALEAAIKKVPVVAYSVDGIGEAIHSGKNGVLVDEGNKDSFIDAISYFLKDRALNQQFEDNAKIYVINNFNWDKIISRYIQEYTRLIEYNA